MPLVGVVRRITGSGEEQLAPGRRQPRLHITHINDGRARRTEEYYHARTLQAAKEGDEG